MLIIEIISTPKIELEVIRSISLFFLNAIFLLGVVQKLLFQMNLIEVIRNRVEVKYLQVTFKNH